MMLVLVCSALPASSARCWNAADVRVANGSNWCRPLCAECALALEARAELEGFRVAFLELEPR